MNTRKHVPWAVLYAALGIMLAASYYVSGLFTLQDVTVFNYGQKLLYIFFHPLHIWWNDKTLMVMGTACILWLMGVSYFLTYYRNYHFGKEHGTADWGEIHSMQKKLADPDPMRNTIISRNISIGFDALSNMNLLIIGGSGSGKTTGIVIPNILLGSCTNVILYIKNYSDLIGLITNIQNFGLQHFETQCNEKRKKAQYLNKEDIENFKSEAARTWKSSGKLRYKYGYVLIANLYLGFRIGELLALTWNDIHFDDNYVDVNKTLVQEKNTGIKPGDGNDDQKRTVFVIQDSTKTNKNRKVPMNRTAKKYLKKHFEITDHKYPGDYVIATKTGNNSNTKNIQSSIALIIKNAHIKVEATNTHIIRHTFVIQSGQVDIVEIKEFGQLCHKLLGFMPDIADIFPMDFFRPNAITHDEAFRSVFLNNAENLTGNFNREIHALFQGTTKEVCPMVGEGREEFLNH